MSPFTQEGRSAPGLLHWFPAIIKDTLVRNCTIPLEPLQRLLLSAVAVISVAACQSFDDGGAFDPKSPSPPLSGDRGVDVASAPVAPSKITAAPKTDKTSVVRRGLLQSPAIRAAAGRIAASQDEVTIQRAAFYPKLSTGVVGGFGTTRSDSPSFEVSGEQLITDFGVTDRAVKAADADVQIRYREFQQTVDDALLEILNAQADVLMYREIEQVRAAQLARMRELHQLVAQRRVAGATSAPDLLETEKRIEQAAFEHLQARLTEAEARTTLMKLAGVSDADALPQVSVADECRAPEIGSNAMQIARLEAAKAQLTLEGAERARLPRLAVAPLVRQPFSGGDTRVGVELRVGSNLFEGGAIKARANAARNSLDAAEASLEDAKRQEALVDIELSRNMAVYREQTATLKRQMAIAAEARDLYRVQYFELGTRSLKDLLDNEDDFYNMKADLVESRYEYDKNKFRCSLARQELRGHLFLGDYSLYGYSLRG